LKASWLCIGVSDPTARATIRALEAAGILVEVTTRRWGRVYRAEEIFSAIRGSDE
jgi:hypothetical protein